MHLQPYVCRDDPLAQQLGPVYGLFPELQTLVGLEVEEGALHIFPHNNNTHAALKAWLIAVREGHSTPSGKLITFITMSCSL
ncbi:hypothetical protein E2C01_042684 [Portunus trituberculatus]|uniref:Uncharacterized protein n=1 Tax=Portunus trituberculatus TaxID=210409 RepID=A0A5B7FVG7_PORTR|nr:hypothetical protein [Portunus trituberculatus]